MGVRQCYGFLCSQERRWSRIPPFVVPAEAGIHLTAYPKSYSGLIMLELTKSTH